MKRRARAVAVGILIAVMITAAAGCQADIANPTPESTPQLMPVQTAAQTPRPTSTPAPTERMPFPEAMPMPALTPALSDVYAGDTIPPDGWNDSDIKAPEPLVYKTQEGFFITNGQFEVALPGASNDEEVEYDHDIRGGSCRDQGYYFYFKDYDEKSDSGMLMRVNMMRSEAPVHVADDVYAYALSRDGQRVLYCKGPGGLYLWKHGGGTAEVADNVLSGRFGFSPDGLNIYYIEEDEQGQHLYIQMGDEPAKMIAFQPAGRELSISYFTPPLSNNGTMIYHIYDTGGESNSYIHRFTNSQLLVYTPDGQTALLDPATEVLKMYGPDDFVYRSEQGIFYKAPGHAPQMLWPDGDEWLRFRAYKRFVLEVKDETSGEYTAYEYEIGKDMVELVRSNGYIWAMEMDDSYTWFLYEEDGQTCIRQKQDGAWQAPVLLSDEPLYESEHFWGRWFDSQGEFLYFMTCKDERSDPVKLHRFSLKTGETELLMEHYGVFFMAGDAAFATKEGVCYRLDGEKRKIAENVWSVEPALGGALIVLRHSLGSREETYDIIFYNTQTEAMRTIAEDVPEIYDELWLH